MVVLGRPGPFNLVDASNIGVGLEDIDFDSSDKDGTVGADLSAGLEGILVDISDIPEAVTVRVNVVVRKGLALDTAVTIVTLRPSSTAESAVSGQGISITNLAIGNECLVTRCQLDGCVLELLRAAAMMVMVRAR